MKTFFGGLLAFACIVGIGMAGQPGTLAPQSGPTCAGPGQPIMVTQTVNRPQWVDVQKTVKVPVTTYVDKEITVKECVNVPTEVQVPYYPSYVPQPQYCPPQMPCAPQPQPYGQGAYAAPQGSYVAAANHNGYGGDYTIDTDGDGDPDYLVHEGDENGDEEPRCLLGRLCQRKRENGGGLFHRLRDRRDNGDSIIPLPEPAPGVPIPLP